MCALSNRPQFSMGYKLINHAGRGMLAATRKEFINREAKGSSLRILRVFYQHPKPRTVTIGTEPHACNSFFMVKMASGIDCMSPAAPNPMMTSRNESPELVDKVLQPWFMTACIFDIEHPCYGLLTPAKTRYPLSLTWITWPLLRDHITGSGPLFLLAIWIIHALAYVSCASDGIKLWCNWERLLNFSGQCFISRNMANNLKETKQAGKLDCDLSQLSISTQGTPT